MANSLDCTCVIEPCKHYQKHISADISQIRRHYRKHDFLDLHNTASKLGLLQQNQYREKSWYVDLLTEFSIQKGISV